ncbi:MAG: 50S ribosomal protein L6 [Armatimonadetes bacterium]|nr:50S ribosomal protein L6 [Armatimonadota bacterium]
MSRIGRMPIAIPGGVAVTQEDDRLLVKGPKGALEQAIPPGIDVRQEDGRLLVARPNDEPRMRALHGLTRTLIANMVKGVTEGYAKTLDVVGVGYRAETTGRNLRLTLGYSHLIEVVPRPGIVFEVGQETNTRQFWIRVSGIDKHLVGQTAAELRALKKPEPYKGKGIRYRGELVRRKAGKSAKGGKGR